MKIKYLGTAAAEGWPALSCNCGICERARIIKGKELRTRTQAIIDDDLVIDFPPDSYIHFMNNNIKFGEITKLLITHSHMDHFFPDDLIHRHEHFGHGAKGILHMYGNEAVMKSYDEMRHLDRFKNHPLDGAIEFNLAKPYEEIHLGDYTIMPIEADHDKREECLVYIISKGNKTLFYGHDTGLNMSEKAWQVLNSYSFDLISLDCTMGVKSIDGYHMGINEIPKFVENMSKAGSINENTIKVINHFSHNGMMNHNQLEKWAEEQGMICTYDGISIEF